MKSIIVIFISLISSCGAGEEGLDSKQNVILKEANYTKLSFPVNNESIDSIGYEEYDDGPDIGITSMIIYQNYAYLIDKFHGNVKRINLTSGEIITSEVLNLNHQPWINDAVVFHQQLLVLSDLDTCYKLSLDLMHKEFFLLKSGDKFFTKINQSPHIYNLLTQECVKLDFNHELSVNEDSCSMPDIWSKSNLIKPYKCVSAEKNRFIVFLNNKIQLQTDFPDKLLRYEARNMDFDENRLTYFEYSENRFIIHVYTY
jgi:hypothetical protein